MDAETIRVELVEKGDRLTLEITDGEETILVRGEPGALLAFAQDVRSVVGIAG